MQSGAMASHSSLEPSGSVDAKASILSRAGTVREECGKERMPSARTEMGV